MFGWLVVCFLNIAIRWLREILTIKRVKRKKAATNYATHWWVKRCGRLYICLTRPDMLLAKCRSKKKNKQKRIHTSFIRSLVIIWLTFALVWDSHVELNCWNYIIDKSTVAKYMSAVWRTLIFCCRHSSCEERARSSSVSFGMLLAYQ